MDNSIPKTDAHWRNLGPVRELGQAGRKVLKVDGLQVALFQTESGLFAINNRCPHEGFPLVEGSLNDSCTLACNWHGWTFDLKTGKTLQGRDPVRTYPVERRGTDIWIDLMPEPAEELAARAFDELDEAVAEHDYSRIARSLCRLEKAGVPLEGAMSRVVAASLAKFERGFGHAHAGLADWIALAGGDPELRLVAFLEAIGQFSWDGLFSPSLEVPECILPWHAAKFLSALEAMNSDTALSMVKGAFAEGIRFADLKPTFLDFIFSHYAGFGHPAIYVRKLETLVSRLGGEVEETLTLQLARYLCVAAREDLIPEFRGYADYLAVEEGDAPVPAPEAFSGLSVRAAMALTAGSLAHRQALFDSLLGASALGMLHFDLSLQDMVEQPVFRNVGWLDFTHGITFAEAVLGHARENPKYWHSGLMQMACFVGRNAPYLREQDWITWQVEDAAAFFAQEKVALFNMDEGDYIYAVHRLKMVCAVEQLLQHTSNRTGDMLLAALNRYLRSRTRQRHPARTAYQARESVTREG